MLWNIWNTDLNENLSTGQGTYAQGGCSNSCGEKYCTFQDFEANAYWRANTGTTGYPTFCNDPNAFHVLANQNRNTPGSCPATWNSSNFDWFTFDGSPAGLTWQQGGPPSTPFTIDEDDAQDITTVKGTCSFNPSFGIPGVLATTHSSGRIKDKPSKDLDPAETPMVERCPRLIDCLSSRLSLRRPTHRSRSPSHRTARTRPCRCVRRWRQR